MSICKKCGKPLTQTNDNHSEFLCYECVVKERDTPMKVEIRNYHDHQRFYCPKCEYYFGYNVTTYVETNLLRDQFCHHCGQRLDWSD